MAELKIIQGGTEAKCFIDIKNVAMEDINFKLELVYGYRRNVIEIAKDDMLQDTQGRWFFMFNTTGIIGVVTARCTWELSDTDCPDSERTKVNEQPLCFVAATAHTVLLTCPAAQENQPVVYTFTDESDISSEYVRLCDCDGHPLVTDDDLYLYVRTDAVEQVQESLNNLQNINND
jgi:hypothetical protein